MSYDLYNPSTNIFRKYSSQFWAKALELARLYGWQPMGTCPPSQDVDWLGVYLTNDGQTVTTGDACLLALALENSLDDISESGLRFDWEPELWMEDDLPDWLSPEERAVIEEGLQVGLFDIMGTSPLAYFAGAEKYHLVQMIRFCKLGSFKIL